MKTKNQTGDLTYREFAQKCLAGADAKPAGAGVPAAPSPAVPSNEAPARRTTTPTGPSATAAQPSIKQCADQWNEMKAKNQTGKQTYREFAQQCLAGTGFSSEDKVPAAEKPPGKDAAQKPRTSVPSIPPRPAPASGNEESDRDALNRCNTEWQDYKARHNLTGAKAWHVFMARCLP